MDTSHIMGKDMLSTNSNERENIQTKKQRNVPMDYMFWNAEKPKWKRHFGEMNTKSRDGVRWRRNSVGTCFPTDSLLT